MVLNFEPLTLSELEKLVRETEILHQCTLLQKLGVVDLRIIPPPPPPLAEVKEFLFNLVQHHHILGQEILIKQAKTQFADVETAQIATLIEELAKEQKISIINPNAKPQERSICLVPQAVVGGKKL